MTANAAPTMAAIQTGPRRASPNADGSRSISSPDATRPLRVTATPATSETAAAWGPVSPIRPYRRTRNRAPVAGLKPALLVSA